MIMTYILQVVSTEMKKTAMLAQLVLNSPEGLEEPWPRWRLRAER